MGEGLPEGAGAEGPRWARSRSDGGNALLADLERFRFCAGDVGERGSAANADAILAEDPQEFVNEAADVGDVGGVTHFGGEFGEWIGARCGESVRVDSAEKVARFSNGLATVASVVERVEMGRESTTSVGC